MTLPNFLVIGAQRAGTTLLYWILDAHPEVYVPRQRKEMHFFDWYHERGEAWYRKFFPPPDAAAAYRAIGEATPDYLATPEAPARIRALLPNCRMVAILRNPVDRAYSWYRYNVRSYNEHRSFEAFLEHDPTTLEWGLYHRHLSRYLTHFPRAALLVLIYEELIADPGIELCRLGDFLGLSLGWPRADQVLAQRINTSELPRFRRAFALARRTGAFLMRHDLNAPVQFAKQLGIPRLFGRTAAPRVLARPIRAQLRAYYQEDLCALEDLLGRALPLWHA
jgi:Sulfotransferase domain